MVSHSSSVTSSLAMISGYPELMAKIVLSSPEDPSPSAGGATIVYRLTTKEKISVYALLLPPRPMLAYALLQVNPEAAHAFASDAEMDARFDRIYNRTRPALHCRSKPPGPTLHGLGFYAHYYPQSATSPAHENFLLHLGGRDIPTLVIKGRCDYLSWSSAQEYLRALPDARLLYLDGSGHNAYQDEPDRYMAGAQAFLLSRPLPERPYEGSRPPDNYEGLP
jgi:proline iminopeptidase